MKPFLLLGAFCASVGLAAATGFNDAFDDASDLFSEESVLGWKRPIPGNELPSKKATGWDNPLLQEIQVFPVEEKPEDELDLCQTVASDLMDALFAKELALNDQIVNYPCGGAGEYPLQVAARGNKNDWVDVLVSRGADVDAKDVHGKTALHNAVLNDNYEMVDRLLSFGADSGASDVEGRTPLNYAMELGEASVRPFVRRVPQVVKTMIEDEKTPIKYIGTFLKAGFVPTERMEDGKSVVHVLARRAGSCSLLKQLAEEGVSMNIRDAQGKTPIFYALENSDPSVLECMLRLEPVLEVRDKGETSPVMHAIKLMLESSEGDVRQQKARDVELLISNGAPAPDLSILNQKDLEMILQLAANTNSPRLAEYLVHQGVYFDTGLIDAALRHKDLSILKMVIDSDYELLDHVYCYTMTEAIYNCNLGALDLALAAARNDILSKCVLVPKAVTQCTMEERKRILQILLDHGADVNGVDPDFGDTALMRAAKYEPDVDLFEFLLKAGAKPNIESKNGDLPLAKIARKPGKVSEEVDMHIVELLLNHGADVNAKGSRGNTPLMWALESDRSLQFLRLLLSYDPDITIANEDGSSPAEAYAEKLQSIRRSRQKSARKAST